MIADGVFLHHPELHDLWDLSVFLKIDREVASKRGIARDVSWMEGAQERNATRYVPGETRYLEEVDPASRADVVIDMTVSPTPQASPRLDGHVPVSDTGCAGTGWLRGCGWPDGTCPGVRHDGFV